LVIQLALIEILALWIALVGGKAWLITRLVELA